MSLDFRPTNPRRPPDWRWQRVGQLIAADRTAGNGDDEATGRLRRFRVAREGVSEEADLWGVYGQFPDLFDAHVIYVSDRAEGRPAGGQSRMTAAYGQEPDGQKAELEARIMANQKVSAIAERVNMTPKSVTAYEKAFFDVRNKLKSPGYVAHQVIGRELYDLGDRNKSILWKLYAWRLGPLALDWLIYRIGEASEEDRETPDKLLDFIEADQARTLKIKSHMATNMSDLSSWESRASVFEAWAKLKELEIKIQEASGGAGGLANTSSMQNITALVEDLAWERAKPQALLPAPEKYTFRESSQSVSVANALSDDKPKGGD